MWRLNKMLLKNQWITDEIKNKTLPRDKWKQKHNDSKPTGHSKSRSEREVYSNTVLYQEAIKTSNNLTLYLKQLEQEEQIKPKASRKKDIRSEINEIETKKTTEKIKLKAGSLNKQNW